MLLLVLGALATELSREEAPDAWLAHRQQLDSPDCRQAALETTGELLLGRAVEVDPTLGWDALRDHEVRRLDVGNASLKSVSALMQVYGGVAVIDSEGPAGVDHVVLVGRDRDLEQPWLVSNCRKEHPTRVTGKRIAKHRRHTPDGAARLFFLGAAWDPELTVARMVDGGANVEFEVSSLELLGQILGAGDPHLVAIVPLEFEGRPHSVAVYRQASPQAWVVIDPNHGVGPETLVWTSEELEARRLPGAPMTVLRMGRPLSAGGG